MVFIAFNDLKPPYRQSFLDYLFRSGIIRQRGIKVLSWYVYSVFSMEFNKRKKHPKTLCMTHTPSPGVLLLSLLYKANKLHNIDIKKFNPTISPLKMPYPI